MVEKILESLACSGWLLLQRQTRLSVPRSPEPPRGLSPRLPHDVGNATPGGEREPGGEGDWKRGGFVGWGRVAPSTQPRGPGATGH